MKFCVLSNWIDNSFINLEEQENNISKEKLKEEEIKKLAAQTQTTAQYLRVNKKRTPVFGSSSGTQTDATETSGNGTQTETIQTFNTRSQTPQPPKTANATTQKNLQGKAKTKDSNTQTGNA